MSNDPGYELQKQMREFLVPLIERINSMYDVDSFNSPYEMIYERDKLTLVSPEGTSTDECKMSDFTTLVPMSKLMKQQPNERLTVLFGEETTTVEVRATMPDGINGNGARIYLARAVSYDVDEDGTLQEGGAITYELYDPPNEDETVYTPRHQLCGDI